MLAANHEATVRQGVDTVSHSLTIVVVFGVWIGGGLLIMQGTMSVPQIVAFYSLIGNISVPLFQMSGLVAQYHAGAAVLERVRRTFDECVSPAGLPAGSSQEPDAGRQTTTGSGVHIITYSDVRFHTRRSESNRTQAPAISVTLRTDRRYLVVGPSGAGKSSLIRPLFRLDDDYQGTITVDGADLRTPAAAAGPPAGPQTGVLRVRRAGHRFGQPDRGDGRGDGVPRGSGVRVHHPSHQ
ncbi:ABC transporter ATP-binding protein [Bifidobacterium saeculare]|nr:ABC transporter ATP-binding protein [Bifidobacterium pullorum subsp. saeculare]